jgi:hypothetical protein
VYTSATMPSSGGIPVNVGAGHQLTLVFSGGTPNAIVNPL